MVNAVQVTTIIRNQSQTLISHGGIFYCTLSFFPSLFLLFVLILRKITRIEWTEMLDKAHSKCWVNLYSYIYMTPKYGILKIPLNGSVESSIMLPFNCCCFWPLRGPSYRSLLLYRRGCCMALLFFRSFDHPFGNIMNRCDNYTVLPAG